MAIRMAGLMAFFQNGFAAAELPSGLIAPPITNQMDIGQTTIRESDSMSHRVKYVFLEKKDPIYEVGLSV